MKRIAVSILMFSALVPFIVSSNTIAPYLDGKVLLIRGIAFGAVLMIALIFLLGKKNEQEGVWSGIKKMLSDPLLLVIMGGLILLGLSTFFAFDRVVAFFGEPQRAEGFLTFFALFAILVSFSIFFDKKDWQRFFVFMSAGSIIIVLIKCIQTIAGVYHNDALSGNPTFLAGYFIFTIFTSAVVFFENKKMGNHGLRKLGAWAFVASSFGVLLTRTRGALLGMFLATIVCLVLAMIFGKKEIIARRTLRFWSASVLIALALFSGIFLATRHAVLWRYVPGLDRVAQVTSGDETINSRRLFAEESLTAFWHDGGSKRVFLGWGWDNYVFFWQKHYNPQIFYYDTAIADRSHNKFIDLLVMTGLLGLTAYISLWFLFIRKIITVFKQNFNEGLVVIFYAITYFTFLFFAFDVPMTILGFYAVIAFVNFRIYEQRQ